MNQSTELINSTYKEYNSTLLWTACEVALVTCTTIDFYILMCLIGFYWKEYRHKTRNKVYSLRSLRCNTSLQAANCGACKNGSLGNGYSSNSLSQSNNSIASLNAKNKQRKLKRWMLRSAIIVSFLALMKYAVDQAKFFLVWNLRLDTACEVINDVTEIAIYGTTIVFVYSFLWLRQWIFYNSPAVKGLLYHKGFIKFIKWLPVIIVILSVALGVVHIFPQRYISYRGPSEYIGCVSVYGLSNPKEVWPIFLYITVTSSFQLSLLMLFIYPILKRKIDTFHHDYKQKKQTNSMQTSPFSSDSIRVKPSLSISNVRKDSSNFQNVSRDILQQPARKTLNNFLQVPQNSQNCPALEQFVEKQNTCCRNSKDSTNYSGRKFFCFPCFKKQKREIGKYAKHSQAFESIRRVVVWCVICILSDITSVSVTLSLGKGTPLILITTFNNLNVLVNLLCLVATYSRWKEIIFPYCSKFRDRTKTLDKGSNFSQSFESLAIRPSRSPSTVELRTLRNGKTTYFPKILKHSTNSLQNSPSCGRRLHHPPSSQPSSPMCPRRVISQKRQSL